MSAGDNCVNRTNLAKLPEAWRRFRALSGGDRRLVAEAAVLLCLASPGLVILPFPVLRRLLDQFGRSQVLAAGRLPANNVRRISWAVTATARRLPVSTSCLVEALVAGAMLRRRGCACELRFGVRTPQGTSDLAAHAWIEHEGVVVMGQLDNLRDYQTLRAPRSSP
jgi:hypothetical protein